MCWQAAGNDRRPGLLRVDPIPERHRVTHDDNLWIARPRPGIPESDLIHLMNGAEVLSFDDLHTAGRMQVPDVRVTHAVLTWIRGDLLTDLFTKNPGRY